MAIWQVLRVEPAEGSVRSAPSAYDARQLTDCRLPGDSLVVRFTLAGLLGLVVPGFGHAYVGRRRAALLFALPVVALIAGVIGFVALRGQTALLALVVAPGVLPVLGFLSLAIGAWRAAAAVDALRGLPRSGGGVAVVALAIVTLAVVPHAAVTRALWSADEFLDAMFASGPDATPSPSPGPTATPGPSPSPSAVLVAVGHDPRRAGGLWVDRGPAPTPTPAPRGPYSDDGGSGSLPPLGAAVPWDRPGEVPWGDDGRFDLLLMGSDAGSGRWSRRVDSLLLIEVDVATGKVAAIGIPRNLQNAPFPSGPARDAVGCGCLTGLINEAYVEATSRHPDRWPGSGSVKGIGAVRAIASELTGRPIDAVLIVDLLGVVRVIDALGGIDIDIPSPVTDTRYPDPFFGRIYLHFDAGQQHLDGRLALAYARTRHADSDYSRMARQQTLLLAIRDQIGPATILDAPALFEAANGTAWTDLPRAALPNLVTLFDKAADARVKQLRIVPPTYSSWLTPARIAKIRADIAGLLGPVPAPTPSPTPSDMPSPSPEPSPTPSDMPTPSPEPSPTPTDTPTPEPTPTPSAAPSAS